MGRNKSLDRPFAFYLVNLDINPDILCVPQRHNRSDPKVHSYFVNLSTTNLAQNVLGKVWERKEKKQEEKKYKEKIKEEKRREKRKGRKEKRRIKEKWQKRKKLNIIHFIRANFFIN